ncbi:MAG: Ca-activated chloride channel, partial [Abditibacteriota bacterium]|nr:Ca-activated chloride channel [Abditibacteriota bacterium]
MILVKSVLRGATLCLLAVSGGSTAAQAQARLMAQRAFSSEVAKPLEMKSLRADVNIVDTVASVTLDYTFRNTFNERLEAVYALPLPQGTTVTDLAVWEDGRPLQNTAPATAATQSAQNNTFYGNSARHQLDAQLSQQLTPNGLNLRFFPIKPLSEWRVSLTYHQVVPFENGKFRFALPLQTRVQGAPPLGSLSLQLALRSRSPITNSLAPGYTLQTSAVPGQSTLTHSAQSVATVPPLNLSYSLESRTSSRALTVHQPGGYEYFVLQMMAPTQFPVVPDHVILLIDSSGSMRGGKLAWSRSFATALQQQLAHTNKRPHVSALSFSSEARRLAEPLGAALNGIQVGGGSDLQSALWEARNVIRATDQDVAFVLLSDGEPTLGSRTLAQLKPALQVSGTGKASRTLRFYAMLIGEDAQSTLIEELATTSGGVTLPLRSHREVGSAAARLITSLGGAAWNDVRVQLAGRRPVELYPKNPAAVLSNSSTFVVGRSPGLPGNAIVTLRETRSGRARTLQAPLPKALRSQSTLAAAAAAQATPQTLGQILPALWAQ